MAARLCPEKRCYMCGAVGISKLIVSCMKCKSSFIHVYCMKTVQLIFPNDWVCEDCHETPKHVASKFTDEVQLLKRPVKVIPADEAIALASHSSLSKGKRHLASPEKDCKTVQIPKNRIETLRKKPSGLPSAEQNRCQMHSVHAHKPSEVPEPYFKQKSCTKNPVHAYTPSPTSTPSPRLQKSFKELFIPTDITSRKSRYGLAQGCDASKDTLRVSKQGLTDGKLTVDGHLPNHPASHATWKGSFRTSGFAAPVWSLDIVWGYPPAKVARKAYEFSKKMPEVLHLEVIPRCTMWANMFNDRGPDRDDIGLYFLPIGDRSEQHYSCLVSHLEKQDFILKSCIRGTELLIFTSSYLDEKSRKINEAYYLWGLFMPPVITSRTQKNQLPSKTIAEPAIQHTVKNEDTEKMEIDILGGERVGNPRDSHLSCRKMRKAAVAASQTVSESQVKLEKFDEDDLASLPAYASLMEARIPPGFEDTHRGIKYKTIADILQSGDGR